MFELIVIAGCGEPDDRSWALVNSTSSLLQTVPKQLLTGGGPPPVAIHMSPEGLRRCSPH